MNIVVSKYSIKERKFQWGGLEKEHPLADPLFLVETKRIRTPKYGFAVLLLFACGK